MSGESFAPSTRHGLVTTSVGACVMVGAVVAIAMMGDRYEPPATRVVPPSAGALELLALHAAREGSSLAVTGLVRSRADEPLTTVSVVISVIDAKGRLVGRGSVPLSAVMPRRESRFAVTIADVGEVARYRVSFRSATGVIRHVDRRVDQARHTTRPTPGGPV